MEFRDAWQKVEELQGRIFHTDRGEEFSYRFHKTYVVASLGAISIPRTNFEKVFRRMQQGEETAASPVQGQRFITPILSACLGAESSPHPR
jgi:hypothetical protein